MIQPCVLISCSRRCEQKLGKALWCIPPQKTPKGEINVTARNENAYPLSNIFVVCLEIHVQILMVRQVNVTATSTSDPSQ